MKFGISLNCLKDTRKLVASGSTRPNTNLRAISNDLKLDLWPKVSLRKEALITKRPSPLYTRRTHLELLWLWWLIMIWSYTKWM
jgi:hypothetical protein